MSSRNLRLLVLVVAVVAIAIYIVLPQSPGIHVGSLNKDFETRLGLDLVGGVQALLEADLPEGTAIDPTAMDTAIQIVENRVNGLGVTEALVQKAGDRRVVVELPGETDPEKALSVLRETGLLEFVDFSELDYNEVLAISEGTIQTNFGTAGQTEVITPTEGVTATERVFNTIMTGADLKSVLVQNQNGQWVITFELTTEGTAIFRDFTTNHVGDILAIVLDKKVISYPSINEPITDGQGSISGSFTQESANTLAVQLRYGSLPIPLKVVETRTVGPTLGQDSLQKSLLAGAIGFAIVILFMALYYRLAGITADISILIYALIAFAIFRFIPVTLTLPGIAGFLLSTGSALDANILIFERIKEELRAGKTLRQSIDLGWKRAWSSIRDSNAATLITSSILYWFGMTYGATIVKGFSITLALGVLVSLFTSLVVTRVLMQLVVDNMKSTDYEKWFGI